MIDYLRWKAAEWLFLIIFVVCYIALCFVYVYLSCEIWHKTRWPLKKCRVAAHHYLIDKAFRMGGGKTW